MYTLMTQERLLVEACRSFPMEGKAMLTMVASRMTTKSAMASSASARHRRGSGMAQGSRGSVVGMSLFR